MSELSDYAEFDKPYELNIGKSFLNGSKTSYHSFKYDFTPASIDKNQEAKVTIGTKNEVNIQVPHVDGSAQKYTQFTGNKAPATNKECVLIYDARTNEFTLERLQSNFILKRSRLEGSSKASLITPRSITPTNELRKKKPESASANTSVSTTPNDNSKKTTNIPTRKEANPSNSKQTTKEHSPPKTSVTQMRAEQLFGDDLNLSDGSDSDGSEL